ncbi:MAG: hypothetical protein ACI4TF_00355 [Oliverpabstia sp.]
MSGRSIAGFVLGLLVLDYTGSAFLYALYMVMYNLPKGVDPTLAGPLVDKFSRRKTVYMLNFERPAGAVQTDISVYLSRKKRESLCHASLSV